MENLLRFEDSLYQEEPSYEKMDIADLDFWVERIVSLPSIRPFCLEKLVPLCIEYSENPSFKESILGRSILLCPVLIYRLFKSGLYEFNEIDIYFQGEGCFVSSYYFRKEFENFEEYIGLQHKPEDIDEIFFINDQDIDMLIEFGFLPSSIEYCLKYDDIDAFKGHLSNIIDSKIENAVWSPFEWSSKPKNLDYLSFSGFFGSIDCFKLLLMNGYALNDSVSSLVVCSGNPDLFHLCNEGISNLRDHIYYASEFFQLSILKFMIEKGFSLNYTNEIGWSPIHIATAKGHMGVLSYLIKNGADLTKKTINGETPLHIASANGNLRIVEYLFLHQVDINSRDSFGSTPLHVATEMNHLRVVQFLVLKGANINVKGKNGLTPIHIATISGDFDVVEFLYEHGALMDSNNHERVVPLHLASENGHINLIEFFLQHNEEIDPRDKGERTPLHLAAANGHFEVVKYLIDHGADVNARDYYNRTPLEIASCFIIRNYIIEHGGVLYQ